MDVYTVPWIVIITGFGLTAFVYLFVSAGFENINAELIEAAQVSGSSQLGVFFRVILPLLRPVLVYGGGVALLLGLGQFTGPLLLGRNAGINVLTTDMFLAVSQSPVDYGQAAAIGSPLLLFGIAVVIFQKFMLGDHSRFVTHGGKSFRGGANPPSWPPSASSPTASWRRSCCRCSRSSSSACPASGAATSRSASSRSTTSARSSTTRGSPRRSAPA